MKWKPDDLGVWLSDVDVNGLSDSEAEILAQLDPSSDEGLDQIVKDWIRPRFEKWDAQNQSEMLAILAQSGNWGRRQLAPVFEQFAFPGADIDFGHFIDALRRHFLT